MSSPKRGAPHGNHNALKHGFYSSAFKKHEQRLLNQLPSTDLTSEIDLIRIANFRFLQALNSVAAPLDLDTQLAALRAVNLSAQSITSLIRAQTLLSLLSDTDRLADLRASLDGSSTLAPLLPAGDGSQLYAAPPPSPSQHAPSPPRPRPSPPPPSATPPASEFQSPRTNNE